MTKVILDPGGANETTLTAEDIIRSRFSKTHTGRSTYSIEIPDGSDSYQDFTFDTIHLEQDDGTFLFRGQIDTVENRLSDNTARTIISGRGPSHELDTREIEFSVSAQLAHEAVEDFWAQTPFTANVVTPSVDNTISNEVVQEASTTSEFNNIVSFGAADPAEVASDEIHLLQTAFTQEGESGTSSGTLTNSQADYSDGEAEGFNDGGSLEWTFTPEYDIQEFAIYYRNEATGTSSVPSVTWFIDGEEIGSTNSITSLGWDEVYNIIGESKPTLSGGEQHTVRAEGETGSFSETRLIDVIAPLDDRFTYTFEKDNGGSSGFLDGPELFPQSFNVEFSQESTTWNITEGTLATTFDDTSNEQSIQLRLDSGTYFPNDGTEDNTETITTTFGSEGSNVIQGRATLSRFGSRTTATPQTGFNSQSLQSWEIEFDGDDKPVINDETFEGTQFQVAQDLHDRAELRFTIEHDPDSLIVESYKAGDVEKSLPELTIKERRHRSSIENYANSIVVKGQRVDGNRISATAKDTDAINEFGEQKFVASKSQIETEVTAKIVARNTLKRKLREIKEKGDLTIVAVDVQPGYDYPNPFDTGTIPIEEVSYSSGSSNFEADLAFDFRTGALVAEDISGLNRETRNAFRGF